MQYKETTLLLLGGVLVLTIMFAASGRDSRAEPTHAFERVYLKYGSEWRSVRDLVDTAWEYLALKTNTAQADREKVVVWINRESTNQTLQVSFGAGMGKPFWEVQVDPDGRPVGLVTGLALDRTEQKVSR